DEGNDMSSAFSNRRRLPPYITDSDILNCNQYRIRRALAEHNHVTVRIGEHEFQTAILGLGNQYRVLKLFLGLQTQGADIVNSNISIPAAVSFSDVRFAKRMIDFL